MSLSGIAHADALRCWSQRAPVTANTGDIGAAELLQRFHPDHQADGVERLRVGVCAGSPCPRDLAALLQANALVGDIDIAGVESRYTDVLVVGAGAAGGAAALTAARSGAHVLLATKLRMGDGNTVMAEGGIQAAVGSDDSLQRHFDDTFAAGREAADPGLVAALAADGPAAIQWLMAEGMAFDRDDDGDGGGDQLHRLRPGGASAARLLSYRDFTGLEMMRAIREAVLLQANLATIERHTALELLTDAHGHCAGAVFYDIERERIVVVRAGATLLATGGAGRVHLGDSVSSNHYGATADGLVMAYRVGAHLREIDSFQYHPTGLAWPRHLAGMLITEAVRAMGAALVNGNGERFVDELAPRDVVAAAMLRELAEGRGIERDGLSGIYLDTPTLAARQPGVIDERLVTLARLVARAGIDPTREPLLVRPTLHYHNGGVGIDAEGQTTVPGLLCAGEVAGGIHGRNRLMGNALLETVVFGRRAGATAVQVMRGHALRTAGVAHLADWQRALVNASLPLDARSPCVFPSYGGFAMREQIDALRQRRA